MANLILIVGDTGTGKSTSINTLPPTETVLINCAKKPLPFKGSSSSYISGKNRFDYDDADKIVGLLKSIQNTPAVKNVVIDDSGFVMSEYFFDQLDETGYAKFTRLAKRYQSILSTCKSLRNDLNVAVMLHDDDKMSNGIIISKKAKTIGKLVDDQYNPLSVVSVALFTDVEFDKDGNPTYYFITRMCKKNGVTIPAKSPSGMFETTRIPNDLATVFKISQSYYN